MRYRIRYLFLLLAIPLQLAAVDYTVSVTTNTCSEPQTYTIPEGEQMVLQAHPMAGYTFKQWSDGNTDNPRIVTVTSDASYAAEFVAMSPMPTIYNVVVSADGCASKEIKVVDGSAVTIYPHAKLGYVFSQWSDGNTDNPRVATINADVTFVAQFKESDEPSPNGSYTIVVKADGCTTNLACDIAEGTAVKLYAEAEEFNYFVQWSDGNTDNPRIVIVTEDKEYTAVFDLIKYSVKFVDADGTQIGETQIVNGGENATPPTPPSREGYTFVGWIGKYTSVDKNATIYASYYKNSDIPELQQGALQGLFSISATQQVHFSQGNLQYLASTNTWRFAENQYDIAGSTSNAKISSSHNEWIDLFGWGTSGWNSGANAYLPYSTSTTEADYVPGNNIANNLKDAYAKADWGVYNAMYNGGGVAGVWRTLTIDEWEYLCFHRENAEAKRSLATVNNIPGYILLPDDWKLPAGISFTENTSNSTTNIYDKAQWQKMEDNGAIFLPTAGFRNGVEVYSEKSIGDYWLATSYDANNANRFYFRKDRMFDISKSNEQRHYGFSVRLVYPPTFAITVNSADSSMGSATGGGTYSSGTTQSIQATPNDCYQFTKWSDGNTDNPRTVLVTEDKEYTAIFEEVTYNINATTNDDLRGKVSITQPTIPYVGFTATADNSSIRMVYGGTLVGCIPDLQYSYNGQSWKKFELSTTYDVEKGKTFYMRGHNPNGVSRRFDGYSYFDMKGSFEGSGDIMTLVDSTGATTTAPAYCFYRLFYYCTALTKAPRITATASNSDTYANMFVGCTNLKYIEVDFTKWNTDATENWVSSIASTGTFVKPTALSTSYGSSYIPSGWTVMDKEENDGSTSNVTSGTYECETTLILTATPNDCYQFTKWSDGNTDNPRTVIVDGDATYTAEFSPNQYIVTVVSDDENQGTVSVEKRE